MRSFLCMVLLLLVVSLCAVHSTAQYSCPLINYAQSITPVMDADSAAAHVPDATAFTLSFINHSPHLSLSFLDVHYSINQGDQANIRLLHNTAATRDSDTRSAAFPPFLLQATDSLDYFFSYAVAGTDLACDTAHFHVTGRDVRQHAMTAPPSSRATAPALPEAVATAAAARPSASEPMQAAPAATAQAHAANETHLRIVMPTIVDVLPERVIPAGLVLADTRAAVEQPSAAAVPAAPAVAAAPAPVTVPALFDASASSEHHNARSSVTHGMAPAVSEDAEPLEQNKGVCPLIPFEQKMLRRSPTSNAYTLSFHNLSPSHALDFLDVHFKINTGPSTNLRLFTDPSSEHASNEERALEGLVLMKGDEIHYAFTYGLKAENEAGSVGNKRRVRACNTEMYHMKVEED